MKPVGKVFLKYTCIVVVLIGLIGILGYNVSQNKKTVVNASSQASVQAVEPEKKAKGASCCKASLSRAKMLTVKNSHISITPSR